MLKIKHILFHVLSSSIIAYIICTSIFGTHGILQLLHLIDSKHTKITTLSLLEDKKQSLLNKVTGLKDNTLDLDLLDERVRESLGYAEDDETVIYNNINQINN